MDVIHEYFLCDRCGSKDFRRICNFSLRFHSINFSDELVYDRLVDEIYQCTGCQKTFTIDQIDEGLQKIKEKHKNASSD